MFLHLVLSTLLPCSTKPCKVETPASFFMMMMFGDEAVSAPPTPLRVVGSSVGSFSSCRPDPSHGPPANDDSRRPGCYPHTCPRCGQPDDPTSPAALCWQYSLWYNRGEETSVAVTCPSPEKYSTQLYHNRFLFSIFFPYE